MAPPAINKITEQDIRDFITYPSLDHYQRIATRTAIYPGQGTPIGLDYVGLKMNGEAGEFAEHIGKAMRDDGLISVSEDLTVSFKPLTPERELALIKELGDVLWYLSAACNELGFSLSYIAQVNLEKLASRSERNALQGSGDER